MIYANFKCYNFHFNNFVGFSILIKEGHTTSITSFMIGRTVCLIMCSTDKFCCMGNPTFDWRNRFSLYQKAFQAKHIVASLKEEKSTLAFVVTEKMKQTLIIICRDADVDGFPIISSISLQLHGEYFCQVYNSC